AGYTPLMHAAVEGHAEIVRRLLAAGADPEAKDALGQTALRKATFEAGHREACRRLLDMPESNGRRQFDAIRALAAAGGSLDAGADPNAATRTRRGTLCGDTNPKGTTPLMVAARGGWLPLVEALLAAGADVSAKNRKGQTALVLAARSGHTAVVERLRAAGA